MTPQEIFDTVARHLFTQGERAGIVRTDDSGYDNFDCLYRAPGGKTCAVGCLIPDAAYRPSMEGSGAFTMRSMHEDVLPRWFLPNGGLLARLQQVHDCAHYWQQDHDMKFALACVADAFGLDKSILDSLSFNREPVEA